MVSQKLGVILFIAFLVVLVIGFSLFAYLVKASNQCEFNIYGDCNGYCEGFSCDCLGIAGYWYDEYGGPQGLPPYACCPSNTQSIGVWGDVGNPTVYHPLGGVIEQTDYGYLVCCPTGTHAFYQNDGEEYIGCCPEENYSGYHCDIPQGGGGGGGCIPSQCDADEYYCNYDGNTCHWSQQYCDVQGPGGNCIGDSNTVDCDNFNDNDPSDGLLKTSYVSCIYGDSSCYPGCEGSNCCNIHDYYCTNDHRNVPNCYEVYDYTCTFDGSYWDWRSTAPGEVCDGIDNDCNGEVDEGGVCGSNVTYPIIGIKYAGELIAAFDSDGDLFIRGDNVQVNQNSISQGSYDFLIKDADGTIVFKITHDGDLYIAGSISYNIQDNLNPQSGSFIIKNSTGEVVAYVDSNGNLYLKRFLTYNYSFDPSGTGSQYAEQEQ